MIRALSLVGAAAASTEQYDYSSVNHNTTTLNRKGAGAATAFVSTTDGNMYEVSSDPAGDCGVNQSKTYTSADDVVARRKTHTRLQHEVDFWVPQAILKQGVPDNGIVSDYITCVVYESSAVAQFSWELFNTNSVERSVADGGPGGDWEKGSQPTPVLITTKTGANRMMCGKTAAVEDIPINWKDPEFHLETAELDNKNSFNLPTFTLDVVNIVRNAECGNYQAFAFNVGICVVTEHNETDQQFGGALFCMMAGPVEDPYFWVYTTSAFGDVVEYYPFRDLEYFKDGESRPEREDYIVAADGSNRTICSANKNAAGAGPIITRTMAGRGKALANAADQKVAGFLKTLGAASDWEDDNLNVNVDRATTSQSIKCRQVGEPQSFGDVGGTTLVGETNMDEKDAITAQSSWDATNQDNALDMANWQSDVWDQEGLDAVCNVTSLQVVDRGGDRGSGYVVYSLCSDGSIMCIGGSKDGMQSKLDSGCLGQTEQYEPNTYRKMNYRFLLTGYFMEPDQNAHKNGGNSSHTDENDLETLHPSYGADPYGGTVFAIGCSLDFTNPSADGIVDIGELSVLLPSGAVRKTYIEDGVEYLASSSAFVSMPETVDDDGTELSKGRPIANHVEVENASCGEYAVCIKSNSTNLAILTVTGRLLVNSQKVVYPFKYGVVFVTSPLRTHELNKQYRQAADPKRGEFSVGHTDSPKAAYRTEWLKTEQGYDALRDAESTFGDFFQVMLSDLSNTGMPQLVRAFDISSDSEGDETSAGALVAAGDQGVFHGVILDPATPNFQNNSWFGNATAVDRDGLTVDMSMNECTIKGVTRNNLTICLAATGLCLFHTEAETQNAVRKTTDAKFDMYTGADADDSTDFLPEDPAHLGNMENHITSAFKESGLMNYSTGPSTAAYECLALYKYDDGCVLVTGIDDTHHKNNDLFECHVNIMVMNYAMCQEGKGQGNLNRTDGFAVETDATNITYKVDTRRDQAASHLLKGTSNSTVSVWDFEFYCSCQYSIEAQISAGILTESGSLGTATEAEVQQEFSMCMAIITDKSDNTSAEKYLMNEIRLQMYYWELSADTDGTGVIVQACTNDPKRYGENLDVGDVLGSDYILLFYVDQRATPRNTSFMLDVAMLPSNHANKAAGGADAGINWGALHDGTSIVKGNCAGTHAYPTAGADAAKAFCALYGNQNLPCNRGPYKNIIPRNTLMSEINDSHSAFGIWMPSTAWLGYSYNLIYAKLTRCNKAADQDCYQCAAAGRRLEASNRQLAAKDAQQGQMQVALHMVTPKNVFDTEGTPFAQNARIEYDNAAVVALFGLVAMLF